MIKQGYKCNYITVISDERKYKGTSISYLCQCKCGNTKYVQDNVIRYGRIQDCGCGLYSLDMAKKDYIGKKYNLLTILDCFRKEYQGRNRIFARCQCDCGEIYENNLTEIKNGHIKSCGCLKRFDFERDYKNKVFHDIKVLDLIELGKTPTDSIVKCKCHCGTIFTSRLIDLIKKNRYIVGCHKCNNGTTPLFNIKKKYELHDADIKTILYSIKSRCLYPNRKDSKWYYDKNIKICDEWLNNSNLFVKWAKENGYKKGLTIDRIDPNGNYCPENCRWVDMYTQNNNHSNSKKYLYEGEMLTLAEISRKTNINYRTLLGRINRGMTIEDALSMPINRRHYGKVCLLQPQSVSGQNQ